MRLILFLVLHLLPGLAFAQLPPSATELIEKLADWEAEQKAILQKNVDAKRSEVMALLTRQLQEVTAAGNLDAAMAIQNEIKRLDPAPTNPYPGSTAFNGHFYKLLPEVSTWHEAQKLCEEMGGQLAMPASAEENEFLIEMARAAKLKALWLGATDEKREGVWVWNGSKIEYSNWDTKEGQPNNAKGVEHYPVIISFATGRWWDFPSYPLAHPDLTGKKVPSAICQWK